MVKTVTKQKSVGLADEQILLSAADCARLCGLSRRTWFRLAASAKCPACVRVGCSPRWRLSDIKQWIEWGCPSSKEFEARKEISR
jgi:predicted DNA-binding transcriptional regulator AlpA